MMSGCALRMGAPQQQKYIAINLFRLERGQGQQGKKIQKNLNMLVKIRPSHHEQTGVTSFFSCLHIVIVRVCVGRHYQQKSNLEEGDYHVSSEEMIGNSLV